MYPVLKSVLLLLTGVAFQVGLTPPTAPPARHQKVGYSGQLFEYLVYPLPWYLRTFATAVAACHAATIALLRYAPAAPLLALVCPAPHPPLARLAALTPCFAAGTALVLAGALVRAWCYHALGSLFTYQVAIRDDHRLVTRGPYAWARHPSYPALWTMFAAACAAWSAGDANLRVCGVVDTPLVLLVHAWVAAAVCIAVGLYRRAPVEDEAMHQRFGGVWEEYRQKVPWKFIPYVV